MRCVNDDRAETEAITHTNGPAFAAMTDHPSSPIAGGSEEPAQRSNGEQSKQRSGSWQHLNPRFSIMLAEMRNLIVGHFPLWVTGGGTA